MRHQQTPTEGQASASSSAYRPQKVWPRLTLEERFWPKVMKGPACWLWTASFDARGYGQINAGGRRGKPLGAHRVAYELVKGEVPAGMVLDHTCRNTWCVNPDHLEPVTQAENMARGALGDMHRRRRQAA